MSSSDQFITFKFGQVCQEVVWQRSLCTSLTVQGRTDLNEHHLILAQLGCEIHSPERRLCSGWKNLGELNFPAAQNKKAVLSDIRKTGFEPLGLTPVEKEVLMFIKAVTTHN